MITHEIARKIEELGLEKIQVRSPMTCDAHLGICRQLLRHGPLNRLEWSKRAWPSASSPPRVSANRGTQLTMRTFHIGGVASKAIEESEIRCKRGGIARFARLKVVRNEDGQQVVLTRNGEVVIWSMRRAANLRSTRSQPVLI